MAEQRRWSCRKRGGVAPQVRAGEMTSVGERCRGRSPVVSSGSAWVSAVVRVSPGRAHAGLHAPRKCRQLKLLPTVGGGGRGRSRRHTAKPGVRLESAPVFNCRACLSLSGIRRPSASSSSIFNSPRSRLYGSSGREAWRSPIRPNEKWVVHHVADRRGYHAAAVSVPGSRRMIPARKEVTADKCRH